MEKEREHENAGDDVVEAGNAVVVAALAGFRTGVGWRAAGRARSRPVGGEAVVNSAAARVAGAIPVAAVRPSGRRVRLWLAFGTIYVVWGSTYLAIAAAVETIPPLLMTAVRSLVAGSLLYGFARYRGAARPTRANWRAAGLTGALLIAGAYGLVGWAETRIASGLAALLTATAPVWAVGLSGVWPGGVRPGRRALAGAALGLVGVALLVGGLGALGTGGDAAGVGAVLLSAGFWALGSFVARGSQLPKSLLQAAGMQLLAGGLVLLVISIASAELQTFQPSAITLTSLIALVYLIAFGSLAGYSAYAYALRETTPLAVTTHAFVNPLIAVLLGWAVADEPVSGGMLLGGSLIAGAVLLITTRSAR